MGNSDSIQPALQAAMSEAPESLSEFVTRQFLEAAAAIEKSAAKAFMKLDALTGLTQQGAGGQPEWAHHQRYLRQRIGDVQLVVGRLLTAQSEMVRLRAARRATDDNGGTLDPRELTVPEQMRLDFESLYIFGNLALDQWAMLMAALAADLNRTASDFRAVFETLQGATYTGVLRPLWARHSEAMIWLFFNLRLVRNKFIEHVQIERHQMQVSGVYTPDFELFMPAPVRVRESLPITDEHAVRTLGQRYLPHVDVDHERTTYVLHLLLGSIGTISAQPDRESIWNIAERIGVQTPSYHIVARRLLQFLDESLGTLIEVLSSRPS